MNKKLKLTLIVFFALSIVGLNVHFAMADRDFKIHQSPAVADTAGVTGGLKELLADPRVLNCITSRCRDLKKEGAKLQAIKNDYIEEIILKAETLNDKEIKKIRKKYNKQLKAMHRNSKNYNEAEYNALKRALINAAAEISTEVQGLLGKIDETNNKMKQITPQLKEAAGIKEPEVNQDQLDVEPEKSSCLQHGDLIAWGIPRVPSIPIPRPKSKPASNTPSSAPAQPSDAGYKALRSVEQQSEKITDADKTEFLNELSTRAAVDSQ